MLRRCSLQLHQKAPFAQNVTGFLHVGVPRIFSFSLTRAHSIPLAMPLNWRQNRACQKTKLSPKDITKLPKCSQRGYSTFVLVGVSSPKCRKWGLVERIGTKFGGLLNWFFLTKCCFQNWFLAQIEASWTGFWLIFRIRNWKFAQISYKIRHFE